MKDRLPLYIALFGIALALPMMMAEPPAQQPPAASPSSESGAAASSTSAKSATSANKSAAKRPTTAEKVHVVETDLYRAEISDLNAGIKRFQLKDPRYVEHDEPIDIVTTDNPEFYPLALDIEGFDMSSAGNLEVSELSARAALMSIEHDGLSIARKLEAGDAPYQFWVTTRITNRSRAARKVRLHVATHHYVQRSQEEGGIPLLPVRSPALSEGLCKHGEDLERLPSTELLDDETPRVSPGFHGFDYRGAVAFAGVGSVYFFNGFAPESEAADECRVAASGRGRGPDGESLGALFTARVSHPVRELQPGQAHTIRTVAYLGPKLPTELAAVGHSMRESIETGWFTALAEGLTWLLRAIEEIVGNWGIAIIMLTLLVKLVLLPLTAKQMQSMAKMKALKPEIDKLNELYADDREKKGAAMMELYRKRGVNPMAGCFPVLLQLPIWFSLYTSLATNVELFRAPFMLWWTDLAAPDPIFALPLGLGVLMFVQQKLTPTTGMDPMQAKIMLYMMPSMITIFMLFLPQGLCLYMFTNSALSIAQQRVIEARLAKVNPPSLPSDAAAPESGDATSEAASAGRGGRKPKRRSRRGRS